MHRIKSVYDKLYFIILLSLNNLNIPIIELVDQVNCLYIATQIWKYIYKLLCINKKSYTACVYIEMSLKVSMK